MIKNENIICISTIDWDFLWQGHQEIMSTFAKNGNRVLFIENTGVRPPKLRDLPRIKKRILSWSRNLHGIRRENDNLFVFSPILLPFPYSNIAKYINRKIMLFSLARWLDEMGFNDPIIWAFLPNRTTLEFIKSIKKKLVIYHCYAEFSHLVENPSKLKKAEIELIKKSDLVFAQGAELKKYCELYNKNVYISAPGVDFELFNKRENAGELQDLRDIKHPIVGYIGGIHKHIDFDLLEKIFRENININFVFVGPVQTEVSRLKRYKNVYFLGQKEHNSIPNYVKAFDAGMIPYVISEYTKTVYPTKLNEYLASGKPVISTPLPEVLFYNKAYRNAVTIIKNEVDFKNCIGNILGQEEKAKVAHRFEVANQNSWLNRIEYMSKKVEEAIDGNFKDSKFNWQENIRNIYRITRRRLIETAAVVLLMYLVIFKTSLVWFIAAPLKIAGQPQKADAIVIFAGGVGESGKAGQGYEERVEYAVELYNKNYADKLIFSSGYTYLLNETEVMKALAVSLGVNSNDIILENKASNTYENVKFTDDILQKFNMKKILLVSSPYHMRRAVLTWKRVDNSIDVVSAPIQKSIFYGDRKKVMNRHIIAIVHEYISIIYYLFKGYAVF